MLVGMQSANMGDEEFARFAVIVCCALGLCDMDGNALPGVPENPYPNLTAEAIDSIAEVDSEVADLLRPFVG